MHVRPPCCGDGSVQDRARYLRPDPHDHVHCVHSDHVAQSPSTGHSGRVHVCFSNLRPAQSQPPSAGGGLSQARRLVWIPVPHDTVHRVQSDHRENAPWTGHLVPPQSTVSWTGPVQGTPLYCGGGLLHVRSRLFRPVPHVTEQTDQLDHKVNPPSTGQGFSKHFLVTWVLPVQFLPPCLGIGSVHSRCRI